MNVMMIVEIVVAVLLVATFGICLVLNRRLGNLRANQDEMRRLIAEFDKALAKARIGLAELKNASAQADTAQEERLADAKKLRDELAFMIETADRLADRLAGEAAGNRAFRPEKPAAAKPAAPVSAFPPKAAAAASGSGSAASPISGLGNQSRFKAEPRSEAERELLMALRQARR